MLSRFGTAALASLLCLHSSVAIGQVALSELKGAWLGTMQIPDGPRLRVGVEIFEKADGRWGGNVAITLDRMPHVGRLRGAWYATGCNGAGVALNTWLGHRLGLVVLGQAPPPSFAELKHRPIPASPLRRAYLPLVGQWFRYQDRL